MASPVIVDITRRLTDVSLNAVRAAVETTWRAVPDLSDEAGEEAVAQVVPIVGGAQLNMAALHATMLSQVVDFVVNTPEVATLIGEAAWNRSPLIQARRLMAEGMTMAEALEAASARAAQVHTGDVLRARSDAVRSIGYGVEPYRPIRWAKVPLPDACEWCRLVSTQLYRAADKLPAHLNDRCGLDAVTPDEASAFSNASTVFSSNDAYRWRDRVQTAEVAEVQRRTALRARELSEAAVARMTPTQQAA